MAHFQWLKRACSLKRTPLFVILSLILAHSIANNVLHTGDTCFSISEKGQVGHHTFLATSGIQADGGFKFSKCSNTSNVRKATTLNVIGLKNKQTVISPDGVMIFTGNHWDNSVRGYNINLRKPTFHGLWHSDVITCLAMDALGTKLISGSRDWNCCIWDIDGTTILNNKPTLTLFGHTSPISDVSRL